MVTPCNYICFICKKHHTQIPKFYMNYLSSCDGSCGGSPSLDPTGCCGWNGVGATVSSDGVHYEDQGIVISKDDGAVRDVL